MAEKNNVAVGLKEPFGSSEVKWRVGRAFADGKAGVLFVYVDARACQERLDEVCGVTGWSTNYRFEKLSEGAVAVCELTANIDGLEVKRTDCAELTEVSDAKGAVSTAFKRACAALGIGRYLYKVGEVKARLENRQFHGKVLLPDEYLPASERQGRSQLEIVYDAPPAQGSWDNATSARTETKNAPANVKAALDFVIKTGTQAGKKLGEVSDKVLGWLHYNAEFDDEKAAADAVYKYRKKAAEQAAQEDDVDIPF